MAYRGQISYDGIPQTDVDWEEQVRFTYGSFAKGLCALSTPLAHIPSCRAKSNGCTKCEILSPNDDFLGTAIFDKKQRKKQRSGQGKEDGERTFGERTSGEKESLWRENPGRENPGREPPGRENLWGERMSRGREPPGRGNLCWERTSGERISNSSHVFRGLRDK
jgi:hypothetical protein